MPNRLFNLRRSAALLAALLALVVGSCQAQQSLRHALGLETPPALYKGKATTQSACATEQPQTGSTRSQAVTAAAILPFFRKSAPLFSAVARLFPLPRQGLPTAAAPPFYILFKRLKVHV